MRNMFSRLLPVLILVFIAASCGKKDKTGLFIPKDASFVMHVNATSLSSKLTLKEVQASQWFQKMYKDTDDTLARKILGDPEQMGIDLKSDMAFFMKAKSVGGYYIFEGKLTDAAKFEAFNKQSKPGATQSKDGDLSFLVLNRNVLLTWNKTHFAYIYDNVFMNYRTFRRRYPDDQFDMKTNMDSVKAYGKNLLNLSGSNALGTDERFVKLVSDGADIHFWANSSMFYNNSMAEEVLSMMTFSELLKDNASAVSISFDNGKVVINSKQYYGKELSGLMKNFSAKKVDAALINRLPAENLMAVLAVNYPPEGVKELIKMTGMDGMLNSFLSKNNYSIDDFVQGNKGEMLIAVTNVTKMNPFANSPDSMMRQYQQYEKTVPVVIIANAVKNKPSFDKLLQLVLGDEESFQSHIPGFVYKMDGEWFVAGNSATDVDIFIANKNNNVPFANRISGHPLGAYIDIQKILKNMASVQQHSRDTDREAIDESVKMWQDVMITGGDFINNAMEMNAEINLVNKNENSLKQLNFYLDKMAGIFLKRMDDLQRIPPDTMSVPPPKAFE